MAEAARTGTYKCAMCHGEFEYSDTWSNQDALEEKGRIFPGVPVEECDVVCDDCFQILNGRLPVYLI